MHFADGWIGLRVLSSNRTLLSGRFWILHAFVDGERMSGKQERHPESRVRELQVTDESFRLLVERVKDYAIFLLDADGHVVTWNTGAQALKGYHADEIIGRYFG